MEAPTYTTTIGTIGGTVLTVVVNIQAQDIIKTAILATIGAVVSFGVSVVLKSVFKKKN